MVTIRFHRPASRSGRGLVSTDLDGKVHAVNKYRNQSAVLRCPSSFRAHKIRANRLGRPNYNYAGRLRKHLFDCPVETISGSNLLIPPNLPAAGNCCGIGTAWCRRAPGSWFDYKPSPGTRVCAAGRSYGENTDGNNWNPCTWLPGRAGDDRMCCIYCAE
jgi:hypothetical protein